MLAFRNFATSSSGLKERKIYGHPAANVKGLLGKLQTPTPKAFGAEKLQAPDLKPQAEGP